MPSRSRKADTRGSLIIPQNPFFGYADMSGSLGNSVIDTRSWVWVRYKN
jgi:hypothetical protein